MDQPINPFTPPIKPKPRFPKYVVILVVVLISTITFSTGYYIGKIHGARTVVPAGEGKVLGQGEIPTGLNKNVDFSLFWDVWSLIKDEYVHQPVSEEDMFYGAMKGMVWALHDAHSIFFDPKEAKEFKNELDGEFEGIGAEIGIRDNQLQIIAPLPGTPADKAGLKAGDKIHLIDGVDTTGMAIDQAVKLIRGERGTDVVLTISHDGLEEVEDISITRDTISIDSVKLTMLDNGIAHIQIYFFNDDTSELFENFVQEVVTSDVKGVVLDLRNNPGGFLTSAIDVASAWVDGNTVVFQRIQDEQRAYNGKGAALLEGIPTVVLVNEGSASASEIVSGALQDYGLATIVGKQTFGKGTVQDYRELSDGSAIKFTIAEWLTPNGDTIDQVGITPDEVVEFSKEQFDAGEDPQLEAALKILLP